MMFAIEPEGGWMPGDRAYCVHGSLLTKPTLEVGKTYQIESAVKSRGMVHESLALVGVKIPRNARGISSGRFVKLRADLPALRQIVAFATPSWTDAYEASVGQAPRPMVRTPLASPSAEA